MTEDGQNKKQWIPALVLLKHGDWSQGLDE